MLSILLLYHNTSASAQSIDVSKLDQYFETLENNNKFLGSVSVFRNGSEIYTKSVGFTDIDRQVAANEKSGYSIGSISKTFTAVMIFQAIEADKLSLSETIDRYFPSIGNAKEITIGHLLGHRSGIHNFTADEQYPNWQTQHKTKEQMVEIIARGGNDFEPDSKAQYSNSNYVLLSYILESVYGKSYAEILVKQVTTPLSLDNTYFGENSKSNSYKYFDRWRMEQKTNPSITLGAGGIVSTPGDINKFADALFSGSLISANSLSVMRAMKDNYGMGLFPVPFHAKQGYGHSGGVDGFYSMLIYFPEDKISYAITANGLNYLLNDIHIAVLSCVYGMPFDVPNFQAVNLNPEDLDKYTGEGINLPFPG
ncbi:MAG: beta-lactamase family protein [Bacteroidales bacterium]|nr:beta-lactamase family protein [Bacteroidales bacterium]